MKSLSEYLYYEEKNPDLKIYMGDCLEIMPLLQVGADLVLTSPPYDNLRDYGGFNFNFEKTADYLACAIKQGGVIVWIVGDATIDGSETGTSFKQALYFKTAGTGLNLHDTMILKKDNCVFPEINRYYPGFEYMFIFSRGKPKTTNLIADKKNSTCGYSIISSTQREKDGITRQFSAKKLGIDRAVKEYGIRTNVWTYSPGFMKTTRYRPAFEHPAMFPESLAKDHVLSWSDKNDLVLDPFLGSGTTLVAAKELKRNGIGIEINEKYCKIAATRLKNTIAPFL